MQAGPIRARFQPYAFEIWDTMGAKGWAAFRSRDFRLFCAARLAMSLGTQVQNVSVAWLVYDLSHNAFALGLVGLASFVPTVVLVLFTGLIADRYSRRWILIISYGLMMLTSCGILVQVHSGEPKLVFIF